MNYHGFARKELLAFLPKHYTRTLEIGCGEGQFTCQLNPCEKWGIEPNPDAAEQAKKVFSHVCIGTFEQVATDVPDKAFDLVVINDVLEHMPDHDKFLLEIQKKMLPGGYLMGSVPNVRFYSVLKNLLCRRDWRYVDAGVLDRTHFRFFTQKSLRRSLEQAGFKIDVLKGINQMRYFRSFRKLPDYLVIFLLEILSIGYQRDIRFPQFAFRAQIKK
jgi:2-polyprenyl-3-methyl-5-hydroxy-6-metoxy-1,4-benzoquinol methylase